MLPQRRMVGWLIISIMAMRMWKEAFVGCVVLLQHCLEELNSNRSTVSKNSQ